MENLVSTDKFKNLLWFKVDMILEKKINKIISNQLQGNFLFYSWRDPENASSCFFIKMISSETSFLFNQSNEAIIGIIPSALSRSFVVRDKLSWGGLNHFLGFLFIREVITEIPNEV
ncbi:hypothetical protein [Dyadobacter bucti]|uniref:hypothetical protein n=1 Tax=Dyadobacter bucti TaxID=2572203 RepID=UPI00110874AF|nr:hypothetical protein [Dyadobacter bucti]